MQGMRGFGSRDVISADSSRLSQLRRVILRCGAGREVRHATLATATMRSQSCADPLVPPTLPWARAPACACACACAYVRLRPLSRVSSSFSHSPLMHPCSLSSSLFVTTAFIISCTIALSATERRPFTPPQRHSLFGPNATQQQLRPSMMGVPEKLKLPVARSNHGSEPSPGHPGRPGKSASSGRAGKASDAEAMRVNPRWPQCQRRPSALPCGVYITEAETSPRMSSLYGNTAHPVVCISTDRPHGHSVAYSFRRKLTRVTMPTKPAEHVSLQNRVT